MIGLDHPVVVFDVDDTLYAEIDYIKSGLRAGLSALNIPVNHDTFQEAYIARVLKGDRDCLIQKSAAQLGIALTPPDLDAFLTAYRDHQPHIQLSPAVALYLDALKRRQIALAVISDGDPVRQQRKVNSLGLSLWCDPIVFPGSIRPGLDKRSPEPFELLMRHFGHGHRFIFVADNSTKDFLHPLRLGWSAIQILRPQRVHLSQPERGAHQVWSEEEMIEAVDAWLDRTGS